MVSETVQGGEKDTKEEQPNHLEKTGLDQESHSGLEHAPIQHLVESGKSANADPSDVEDDESQLFTISPISTTPDRKVDDVKFPKGYAQEAPSPSGQRSNTDSHFEYAQPFNHALSKKEPVVDGEELNHLKENAQLTDANPEVRLSAVKAHSGRIMSALADQTESYLEIGSETTLSRYRAESVPRAAFRNPQPEIGADLASQEAGPAITGVSSPEEQRIVPDQAASSDPIVPIASEGAPPPLAIARTMDLWRGIKPTTSTLEATARPSGMQEGLPEMQMHERGAANYMDGDVLESDAVRTSPENTSDNPLAKPDQMHKGPDVPSEGSQIAFSKSRLALEQGVSLESDPTPMRENRADIHLPPSDPVLNVRFKHPNTQGQPLARTALAFNVQSASIPLQATPTDMDDTVEAIALSPLTPQVGHPIQTVAFHPQAMTNGPIHRQLVEAVQTRGTGTVDLTLNPEELGRVRLSIVSADQDVSINIVAERPETLDLIKRNIDQLSQELRQLGYQNAQFSYGDGAQKQRNKPAGSSGPAGNAQGKNLLEDITDNVGQSLLATASGMDIRL